jgi:hypothetical protein
MHLVFPYVEVSFGRQPGRQVKCTHAASAAEDTEVDICQPLFFSLKRYNLEALAKGREPLELTFILKHRNRKPSVFKRDQVLGKATLKILSPTLDPVCLRLQENGQDNGKTLIIRASIVNLAEAPKVLGQSHDFPLVKVLNVLTTVLRSPDGINLLMKARPKRLRSGDGESVRRELAELVERLADEITTLERQGNGDCDGSECSEADVIKRFSIYSRGLLVFVERATSAAKRDYVGICIKWIRNFFKEYVQVKSGLASAMMSFNEERVRRLLEAAQVQVENLQPCDGEGRVLDWKHKVATSDQWWWKCAKLVTLTADAAVIGDGSFGCVWRARDVHTKKLFAVKNVPVHAKGSYQDQVAQREIDLLHRICMERHPCIVDLYFAGQCESEKLYVHVMEYCSGGNLKDKLSAARCNGTDYECPPGAMNWIGEILLALEYLHLQVEVLHRDIKSENVVFSVKDVAKLTDFGVGRFGSTAGEWTFNFPPGSLLYIAPEVLRQETYDCRADLFSFGVLVWVILTGGLGESCLPPAAEDITDNWRALSECIADPSGHSVVALPSMDASDFVLQLTHPQAAERPMHERIRDHAFITQLALPIIGARAAVVNEWIESRSHVDLETSHEASFAPSISMEWIEDMPLRQSE